MTKLEREKYLLSLNEAQRIALLLALSNHLKGTDNVSPEYFEWMLTSYRPKEKRGEGR